MAVRPQAVFSIQEKVAICDIVVPVPEGERPFIISEGICFERIIGGLDSDSFHVAIAPFKQVVLYFRVIGHIAKFAVPYSHALSSISTRENLVIEVIVVHGSVLSKN